MVEEFLPHKLNSLAKYNHVEKTVCEHIRKGHRREQAFIRAGISKHTMYNWLKHYREETEAGLDDTILVRLWTHVLEAEAEAEADIIQVLRNKAIDGDTKSCMYILDKRFGWSSKQEVELSAKDDGKVCIEIVDMTSEFDEDKEVVSDGKSGDDQDTAEVHQ